MRSPGLADSLRQCDISESALRFGDEWTRGRSRSRGSADEDWRSRSRSSDTPCRAGRRRHGSHDRSGCRRRSDFEHGRLVVVLGLTGGVDAAKAAPNGEAHEFRRGGFLPGGAVNDSGDGSHAVGQSDGVAMVQPRCCGVDEGGRCAECAQAHRRGL
jgi:hypothetical protein